MKPLSLAFGACGGLLGLLPILVTVAAFRMEPQPSSGNSKVAVSSCDPADTYLRGLCDKFKIMCGCGSDKAKRRRNYLNKKEKNSDSEEEEQENQGQENREKEQGKEESLADLLLEKQNSKEEMNLKMEDLKHDLKGGDFNVRQGENLQGMSETQGFIPVLGLAPGKVPRVMPDTAVREKLRAA